MVELANNFKKNFITPNTWCLISEGNITNSLRDLNKCSNIRNVLYSSGLLTTRYVLAWKSLLDDKEYYQSVLLINRALDESIKKNLLSAGVETVIFKEDNTGKFINIAPFKSNISKKEYKDETVLRNIRIKDEHYKTSDIEVDYLFKPLLEYLPDISLSIAKAYYLAKIYKVEGPRPSMFSNELYFEDVYKRQTPYIVNLNDSSNDLELKKLINNTIEERKANKFEKEIKNLFVHVNCENENQLKEYLLTNYYISSERRVNAIVVGYSVEEVYVGIHEEVSEYKNQYANIIFKFKD